MENYKIFKESNRVTYYVSNRGVIKSIVKKTGAERYIKPLVKISDKYDKQGYLVFGTNCNSKPAQHHIHRVVCELFVGLPSSEKMEVNHKDGNKHNNAAENLEWVTRQENTIHAHKNNLIKHANIAGENNPNFKYSDCMALASLTLEKKYTRGYLAQVFNVHKSVIDSGLVVLRRKIA